MHNKFDRYWVWTFGEDVGNIALVMTMWTLTPKRETSFSTDPLDFYNFDSVGPEVFKL